MASFWEDFNSIALFMNTFPLVLAALTAWAVWRAGAFLVRRCVGPHGGRPASLLIVIVTLVVLITGEMLAWHVVCNVDIPVPKTQYASGYSRENFNAVREGDPVARVRALIGEPIDTVPWENREIWTYSLAAGGYRVRSHWVRKVVIDRASQRVVDKYVSFYTGL